MVLTGDGRFMQVPDGQVYQVGDNNNHCGSMACNGGKSRYATIHGELGLIGAVCDLPGSILSDKTHHRKNRQQNSIYHGSRGWGGTCTCPDGLVYYVGDQNNSCVHWRVLMVKWNMSQFR